MGVWESTTSYEHETINKNFVSQQQFPVAGTHVSTSVIARVIAICNLISWDDAHV